MFQIPDMSKRLFVPELMDDTGCSEDELFCTLRQFKTLNGLFSRSRTLVKRYIIPHMKRCGNREIVCADIGAGGGDFALWFTRLCRAKGLRVKMLCIDHDPRIVRFARAACLGRPDIAVLEGSAAAIDKIGIRIDYIFSNHFLHHVDTAEIPALINKMHSSARCGFLINDLARSRPAYAWFSLFCKIFFRTTMSFVDGRLSIRKGFTEREMASFASQTSFASSCIVGKLRPARVYLCCLKNVSV